MMTEKMKNREGPKGPTSEARCNIYAAAAAHNGGGLINHDGNCPFMFDVYNKILNKSY